MDLLILAAEYSDSVPVNPVRGSGVLALVVIVGLLMIIIPTRKK